MDQKSVMKHLKACGSEQTRKTYLRHGIRPPLFGVSYAELGKLKKKIKVDHALALTLFETGNHDAMTLATMIVDPDQMSSRELDAWLKAVENYGLNGAVADVASRSPHAIRKAEIWRRAKAEWKSSAAWSIVTRLANTDRVDDAWLSELLDEIESDLPTAQNRTRYCMNNALIAIGGYRPKLRKRALAVAKAIGKVEVDHGDTACKTPDAKTMIGKMAERYDTKKTAKKAVKKPAKKAVKRPVRKRAKAPAPRA